MFLKGVAMSVNWVKASLRPMLGPLPGWTVLPLPYLLLSFSVLSITLTISTLILSIYLTKKGRNLIWVIRRTKGQIRGNKMESRPLGYRRRLNAMVHVNFFDFDSWRTR